MEEIIAILIDIRSMHNVGSIFRTADAAGVEKLYLCGITPTPIDRFGKVRPQIAKVSLGAEKTVNWEKCTQAARLIEKLKKQNYKIFAIEQSRRAIPYFKLNVKGKMEKVVLVVGSEIKGLTKAVLQKSDKILEIPMSGRKESLNVAVAFGIVAFHLVNIAR